MLVFCQIPGPCVITLPAQNIMPKYTAKKYKIIWQTTY
uniref:Uncharacterized protein n=1 Tax=Anguilla anguilla TaxID=7936 RepID=A0A0E9PA78_ANGAN